MTSLTLAAHLLKSKRFLPLFLTQFFGAFNDNIFKNAFLIWFTYDMAKYSSLPLPTMAALASGLFILPFFLFSATAGQLADKYDKAWLARLIKKIEIGLMILCALNFYLHSVQGLLAILFLMGTHSTFFGPLKYSLLPTHLHTHELISGNGLIESGTFLAILLGTLFGGLIIHSQYGVNGLAISLIGCALLGYLASRAIPAAPSQNTALTLNLNIVQETWRLLSYAYTKQRIWLAIIGISWFWLLGATVLTQLPVYTQKIIGGNAHIVTLFLTLFSLGIGLGSLTCNQLLKGHINASLVPYGTMGITLAIIVFITCTYHYPSPASPPLLGLTDFLSLSWRSWGIISSLLALAFSAGLYIVPLYAIMQHDAPSHHIARIIAANNIMNALFMVLASIMTAILIKLHLDILRIFLLLSLLNLPLYLLIHPLVKRRTHV